MDLRTRIRGEIIVRQLGVGAALEAIKKAEREARKEKRSVPRSEMEKLQANLKFCKGQLESAHISFEAVNKYPPLA